MGPGSIVGLKKPLSRGCIEILKRNNITRWPEINQEYECDYLRKPTFSPFMKLCIVLVEFPEFEVAKLDVNVELFRELLPPLEKAIVIEEELVEY